MVIVNVEVFGGDDHVEDEEKLGRGSGGAGGGGDVLLGEYHVGFVDVLPGTAPADGFTSDRGVW